MGRIDKELYEKQSFFERLNLSKDVWVDNFVFRLHYLVSVSIIVAYTVILTMNQYAGEPIECLFQGDKSVYLDKYMNDYCYIHGTKTFPNSNCKLNEGHGSLTHLGGGDDEDQVHVEHTYYQWVTFMLLAQAVCFYIPGGLWKTWEGGRVGESVGDNGRGGILTCLNKDESLEVQGKQIAKDIQENLGKNSFWAVKFTMCEFLNLGNVIGQFYLTNWFLGGEFTNYGISVAKFFNAADPMDRCDPMDQMLPTTAECNFHYFGQAGYESNKRALCVLATNIWNQKFYLFFYYWLLFLISVTSLHCIYRILTIFDRNVRDISLQLPEPKEKQGRLTSYGDWLYADLVVGNLSSMIKPHVKKQFSS